MPHEHDLLSVLFPVICLCCPSCFTCSAQMLCCCTVEMWERTDREDRGRYGRHQEGRWDALRGDKGEKGGLGGAVRTTYVKCWHGMRSSHLGFAHQYGSGCYLGMALMQVLDTSHNPVVYCSVHAKLYACRQCLMSHDAQRRLEEMDHVQ